MAFAKPASSLSADYRIRYKPEVPINEAVGMLGALDEVELAEPNRWREIQTAGQAHDALPWGIVRTKCPDAWKRSVGERGVTVAVVDTGVHLSHPDLSPALIDGKDLVDLGPQPTAPPGWVFEGDFMGLDSSPQDEVGHGTHVAGVICCRPNESAGVAGMTWTCTLRPVRVLARIRNRITNRVSGVGSAADIAAGIRWAVDQGVRVINLSLGGYRATSVERRAIEYAINHDVAVIAAMGNDNTSTPSYPAAFPGVIAVGATTEDDQKAAFSNVGPHISVCAPGVDIMSTYWGDRLYASLDGTSMASPHVAGLAALVLSRNPGLTASSMSQVIRDTARPLLGNPSGTVPNHQYGSGIIDAQAAVP
ncbi:S8 family serine peptidase [Streptomyces sp. NPDC006365]|uniref:S8 family serine peptidase n=1 Tax=Streptomyces sp. NPDC006365 TaxID=3364744 RepID=UPI00367BDA92